jgi:hypothetical protein
MNVYKRGSDSFNNTFFLDEALDGAWLTQHLLHNLGACQVQLNVWTFNGARALYQQSGVPFLFYLSY